MLSLSNKKILITGGNGFLGKSLTKKLRENFTNIKLILPTRKDCDFTKENQVKKLFTKNKKIDFVFHLASSHGGLYYNIKNSGKIYYRNILLNSYLMHYAMLAKVKKFVCAGTVDSYPKGIKLPWKEKDLWNGFPEGTSAAYAFSKKMMIVQASAYRKQYNFKAINLLFMNLYGPNDNFNLEENHVIPAIIKKIFLAKKKGQNFIKLFGSGNQRREFLYVDDAAEALILALKKYDSEIPLNIGTGRTYSIKELASKIIKKISPKMKVKWVRNSETGIFIKKFDISRANKIIGFKPKIELDKGLTNTILCYDK